jgi:hypothetical protein
MIGRKAVSLSTDSHDETLNLLLTTFPYVEERRPEDDVSAAVECDLGYWSDEYQYPLVDSQRREPYIHLTDTSQSAHPARGVQVIVFDLFGTFFVCLVQLSLQRGSHTMPLFRSVIL